MSSPAFSRCVGEFPVGKAVLLAVFLAASCGTTAGDVFAELAGGVTTIARDCGPGALSDYADVQRAIHDGGSSWVSVVFDALGCIEPVVRDELAKHGVAELDGVDRLVELAVKHRREALEALPAAIADALELEAEYFVSTSDAVLQTLGVSRDELRRARVAIALERATLREKVKHRRRP